MENDYIEYLDEDDLTAEEINSSENFYNKPELVLTSKENVSEDADAHITDTKDYDPNKISIESPEEVENKYIYYKNNNPNVEFSEVIKTIEDNLNRRLTDEEYIKACDSYATILVERDEKKKSSFNGKYEINPIKKEKYKELLLNNRPVTNALKELLDTYEQSMIKPIVEAYKQAVSNEPGVIELKGSKKRVNTHYKGKCRIASDESGKVVIIDHKKDIDLLRMKYRKEWIEKRFPDVVDADSMMLKEDDDGEFV
jgi:hypothetical protein